MSKITWTINGTRILFVLLWFVFLYALTLLIRNPDNEVINYRIEQDDADQNHVNVFDSAAVVRDNSTCVPLSVLPALICVHQPEHDLYISRAVAGGGFWDTQEMHVLLRLLRRDPELHVIDVGANIGQFTLAAAALGRRAVAVEARLRHVRMLHHAFVLNGFQRRVTLVHNAVAAAPRRAVMLAVWVDNQGATHVVDAPTDPLNFDLTTDTDTVNTILLSDLGPIIPFKKAVLKIDVEGFEDQAFKHFTNLLRYVSVPHVLVEWLTLRRAPPAAVTPLLARLVVLGYTALDMGTARQLNYEDWTHWPGNVYFTTEDTR